MEQQGLLLGVSSFVSKVLAFSNFSLSRPGRESKRDCLNWGQGISVINSCLGNKNKSITSVM